NDVVFFAGRRRHTSFSRDWSSDVCSSDLSFKPTGKITGSQSKGDKDEQHYLACWSGCHRPRYPVLHRDRLSGLSAIRRKRVLAEIGRASCRERGWVAVGRRCGAETQVTV